MSQLKSWTVRNVLLPMAIAPTRSKYLKHARDIERRQQWPIAQIEAFQLARLRHLAELAERDSAFYRQRWSELNLDHRSLNEWHGHNTSCTIRWASKSHAINML